MIRCVVYLLRIFKMFHGLPGTASRFIYKYRRYTLTVEYSIFDIMTCSSSDYICALNCD